MTSDSQAAARPSRRPGWPLRTAVSLIVLASLAVGAVWILGGREVQLSMKLTIPAPADRVFAALTEHQQILRWASRVKSIQPLTEGGHRVGACAKMVVEDTSGARVELTDEVLQSEAARLLEVRAACPLFELNNRYELQPQGRETIVTQTLAVRYLGAGRLFAPFAAQSLREGMERDFRALSKQAAADAADAGA